MKKYIILIAILMISSSISASVFKVKYINNGSVDTSFVRSKNVIEALKCSRGIFGFSIDNFISIEQQTGIKFKCSEGTMALFHITGETVPLSYEKDDAKKHIAKEEIWAKSEEDAVSTFAYNNPDMKIVKIKSLKKMICCK